MPLFGLICPTVGCRDTSATVHERQLPDGRRSLCKILMNLDVIVFEPLVSAATAAELVIAKTDGGILSSGH